MGTGFSFLDEDGDLVPDRAALYQFVKDLNKATAVCMWNDQNEFEGRETREQAAGIVFQDTIKFKLHPLCPK